MYLSNLSISQPLMNENKIKKISKHLSYVLRYKPEAIGLELDNQGWARINDLMAKSPKNITREILEHVVETNDKKRFIISEDGHKIRANQGHSIEVNLGLPPMLPPEILFHGTATRFIEPILKDGLKKMSRQHVHLSADIETAQKVGMRHGKSIILIVDTPAMVAAGYEYYLSKNGVWLTDHVPAKYLSKQNEVG